MLYLVYKLNILSRGSREMAQWFRVLSAFTEDLGFVPSHPHGTLPPPVVLFCFLFLRKGFSV